MAKASVRQWSTTAASNLDISSISLAEGVTRPSDVNDFERAHMSQVAQYLAEMSYPAAGGSADVLTLTPTTALAALASNVVYTATIATTNATTTPTLNVSATGAKVIRKIVGGTDVAVAAGDLTAGLPATFLYSSTANSAGGAWILVNPAVAVVTGASISTVASATSTLIGAATSQEVNITGTTTITSFDTVTAGTVREGYFSGALTLTHSGTALILPGGISITTAANDRFRALSLGSGNWIVLGYEAASGVTVGDMGISTIASATTTSIAAAGTYNQVSITGTTTITSFGAANAGIVRRGVFTGILTLTYNASSLILPSAASITTAAGDTFEAESLGSGNWRVQYYTKADGTAVVAGAAGQPIPTSSTFAVGTMVLAFNNTGGSVANGATAAGTSLKRAGDGSSGGVTGGVAFTGTWMNVGGASSATGTSVLWVRTV